MLLVIENLMFTWGLMYLEGPRMVVGSGMYVLSFYSIAANNVSTIYQFHLFGIQYLVILSGTYTGTEFCLITSHLFLVSVDLNVINNSEYS